MTDGAVLDLGGLLAPPRPVVTTAPLAIEGARGALGDPDGGIVVTFLEAGARHLSTGEHSSRLAERA